MEKNEIKKDSLGEKDAWAKWEKGYMDRTHKFKGTKYEKPISAEENKREMESERGEFMYDKNIGQIRLRKTDDAENPIEREKAVRRHSKGVKIRKSPLNKNELGKGQRALDSVNANKLFHQQKKLFNLKKEKGQDTKNVERSINQLMSSNSGKYINQQAQDDLNKKSPKKSPLNMVGIGVSRNSRCWEGYEPTPGVKPYAKGSCRKK